jgi:hypothetical protein
MMRSTVKHPLVRLLATLAAWACLVLPAGAQLSSITVSLVPASVAFALTRDSASNPGNATLSVTTAWSVLLPGQTIALYGYFASASAALAHTTPANIVDIPSSRVSVSVNGGAAAAFDQIVAFGAAGAGRRLVSQGVTLLTLSGNRTDTLALNINLSGYTLIPDTYTGTLRIRAQVTP